jgi:hypothetical protein
MHRQDAKSAKDGEGGLRPEELPAPDLTARREPDAELDRLAQEVIGGR